MRDAIILTWMKSTWPVSQESKLLTAMEQK